MQTIYEHFEMLCFTNNKLPLWATIYKYILYGIVRLHQGIFCNNWK
jgi:hypothetical protein